MEEKEKMINVRVLGSHETGELDFETPGNLPGFQEEGQDVYCKGRIYQNKDGKVADKWYAVNSSEGDWIGIKELRELLDDFEKKGATHVSMEHHCDHHSYMFDYGVLSVATDDEVDAYENRDKEKEIFTAGRVTFRI